jgi:hypothetical protein
VDVPLGALLQDVGDLLAVGVQHRVGEPLGPGRPQLGVAVLPELPHPEPAAPPGPAGLVQGQDPRLVVVELDRVLPGVLEDDPEDLDAPAAALGDELGVVDEPVDPVARRDLPEGLLLQIGKGQVAAPKGRPDEHGRPVVLQVVDHPQPPGREAGMVVVLLREPGVEVDPAFHSWLLGC